MTITKDDQYLHPPRISIDRFGELLKRHANPAVLAERSADEYYQAIVSRGVDPLFVLAMFNHESTMGKAGVAVTSKSWGNTRAPNFGATPIGEMPGRTGVFPIWRSWLDGCISTVARLATPDYYYAGERRNIGEVFNDPHYPNRDPKRPIHPPNPRPKNSPREWAPAGDLNSPSSYLGAMLRFMNEHQDIGNQKEPPAMKPRIALAAGHHNTNRGGAAGEYERTGLLTREIANMLRAHGGFDVHVITPNDGLGDYPGGLQDVARKAADLNPDLFLEVHFEGVSNQSVRGCFAIYPDWGDDVDVDVRDRLGPDMALRVRDATGIPLRGNGTMSEKNTGVGKGGKGSRLGAFAASVLVKATCTRMLFEYGALTNPKDKAIIDSLGFYGKAARGTVDAIAAFYDVVSREPHQPETPPDARHFPETGYSIGGGFKGFFEKLEQDGTVWHVLGYPETNEFKALVNGKERVVQRFQKGYLVWLPENKSPWHIQKVLLSEVEEIEKQRRVA